MTSGVGSMAVTEDVLGRRAAQEAKMPPPQPMSRYEREDGSGFVGGNVEVRHVLINSWRRGFIRWRSRDGPWGSHHVEARREKWETSVEETEDEGGGDETGEDSMVE
jgi:hypothetical protein